VRNGIVRLLSSGTVDPTFAPATGTNAFTDNGDYMFLVHSLLPQDDGKVLVGGEFGSVGGFERHGLVRLNADGSVDTNFVPPFQGYCYVLSMVAAPQDRIYVAGVFSFDGDYFIDGVLRLNADGSVDPKFQPAIADGLLYTLALQADGHPMVGGNFDRISGTPRFNSARLIAETPPVLRLERIDSASVRLSWPAALSNLIVESTTLDSSLAWSGVTPAPVVSNGRQTVTNAIGPGGRLYRPRVP